MQNFHSPNSLNAKCPNNGCLALAQSNNQRTNELKILDNLKSWCLSNFFWKKREENGTRSPNCFCCLRYFSELTYWYRYFQILHIDINIFQKCRLIDNGYSILINRTVLALPNTHCRNSFCCLQLGRDCTFKCLNIARIAKLP